MSRLLLAALLLLGSGLARAAEVLDLRVWPLLDRSRVEIAIAGDLDHQVFSVEGPDRLVIDLARATWSGPRKPEVRTPELAGLRWGARNGDGLRLVFDLTGPAQLTTTVLGVRHESGRGSWLVIEVSPRARKALPWPAAGVASDAAQQGPSAEVTPRIAAAKGTRVAAPEPAPMQRQRAPAEPPAAPAHAVRAESGPTAPVAAPQRAAKPLAKAGARQRTLVVAIDPGHGGVDPGAAGRHGTREKDVTLAIARELAKLIDREPGMRAILTRDRDVFIPLRRRTQIARERGADLFLSIHADAFHQREVQGSSVYVLSSRGASSEQARLLAERENAVDLLGDVSLDHPDPMVRSVLLDLAQTGTQQASERVAAELLQALGGVTDLHRKEVQHAGFAVLKSPDVPSVLVETAYISNPDEERRLADRNHQRTLAKALMGGIRRYFSRDDVSGALIAGRVTP